MTSAVILEHHSVCTALGNLPDTVSGLIAGKSGINKGPCFGIPIPCAVFPDSAYRDVHACAKSLAASIRLAGLFMRKTVFIYAAAKGDIRAIEDKSATDLPSPLPGFQAESVKEMLGLPQAMPAVVVSNACASGSIAIETACEMLAAGLFDTAILFAYDSLTHFVASGFQSLGALSPTQARPFDKNRDGLTLGEGAALAVLAKREAMTGDICITGCGSSNDANHRTGPSRTGDGLYAAAAAALAQAGLSPGDIAAIKCHGTATVYNDAMEAKALFRMFGKDMPPCFSVKGAIGHTSGASSLMEILLAAGFLKQKTIPPTAGFEKPGVDEPVSVSSSKQKIRQGKNAMLCLSAGFGGVNSACVIQEAA